MSARTEQQALSSGETPLWIPAYRASLDLKELVDLAVCGLVQMFDPDAGLFCHRLNLTSTGLVREGYSPRYTTISLLGLRRLECSGVLSPIDIRAGLQSLLKDRNWIQSAGDLGLLLWLCAEVAPEDLERICLTSDLKMALSHFSDAREGRTMELAWLLSGLAHAALARADVRSDLTNLTAKVFGLIRSGQGQSGLFGHLTSRKTFAGIIRGRVGSFADQVYPIYALARLAEAYEFRDPLEMARKCAQAICELQGPLGQWWWHYDSQTGRTLQRYPAYSVHQDGMAPMALFALGEAGGGDFTIPINRGLQWITGKNELKYDLRDASGHAIWRSIYPKSNSRAYLSELLTWLGLGSDGFPAHALSIKLECRPYHFGWLLYALAPRLVGQA
jgi:hypothetical protein